MSATNPTSFATAAADGYVEVDGIIFGKGGSLATGIDADRVSVIAKVALGVGTSGGGVFSWQNPESTSIIIDRIFLNVTTAATAAATVDVGTTATNATTSSDNLIDGLDVNTAAGLFDNITDKGTNGKSRQLLASGKWVTASQASGAVAGLVGYAYISYFKV